MVAADLDHLYGPALPPGRPVLPHEYVGRPRSLTKLDHESAVALKAYLDRVNALPLINAFPEVFHLLWIVDIDGEIWFAVEEVLDEEGNFIGVLPKATQARPLRYTKLGHPTLVHHPNKLARIGGEVCYAPGVRPEDFCITNDSGRYGTRPHQRKRHLKAVAGKFSDNGLYFWKHFEPPKSS